MRTVLSVKIGNILVKHLSRPQSSKHLVCHDGEGCCLICGHPYGTKEVRKRIGYIVKDIIAVVNQSGE